MDVMFRSNRQDWETPPEVFDSINSRYGPLTFDVCALAATAKLPDYFTPDDDALTREWRGRCWMNPPYGREIGKWIAKARAEADAGRASVVALIPARTDTRYWHEHIFGVADRIDFIRGRIKFLSDGEEQSSAPFPSAVVVWEARNA